MGHALLREAHMFGVLIESRAGKQRRTGGALLSVVLHVALVAAAVVLTRTIGSATPPPEAPLPPVIYTAVEPTPEPITQRQPQDPVTPSSDLPPLPTNTVLIVPPVDIPTTIPPIAAGAVELDPSRLFIGSAESLARRTARPGLSSGNPNEIFVAGAVERVAALVRPVRPHYPDVLRLAGIEGRVVIRFVVDTAGVVERETIQTMESSHVRFENAARDALPRMRFKPAEIDGKPVRMLVEMPFDFRIGSDK
jgi:periplasmic protein TonB